MASSISDTLPSRPAIRARQPSNSGATGTDSPRTPHLGRSISSQFGSPSAYRGDQEDQIVYELGARHFSAGFAGESRPRCILHFTPEDERRVGDYRACDPEYKRKRRKLKKEDDWGRECELYRADVRSLDLGLVEDKLERAVRRAHTDYLQLDQKPRKAILVIPSLLSTPLLEIALKVLFNHYAQPPTVVLMTTPLLACVGAGLRNALVLDIGWEESVVTAVGEYREVAQRRSVRGGKTVTWEMAKLLEEEVKNQNEDEKDGGEVTFEYAEEVTQRMGWCRSRAGPSDEASSMIKIASPDPDSQNSIHLSFLHPSKPAETALFTSTSTSSTSSSGEEDDDHNLTLPTLAYLTLLSLPLDLRALCTSRIVVTGGLSNLPGLKSRLLQEISHLVETKGWDPIRSYGSATKYHDKVLKERSANIAAYRSQQQQEHASNGEAPLPSSPSKSQGSSLPASERPHDDQNDAFTKKVESKRANPEVMKAQVRGVETLGAWAGASLVASLRVKGAREFDREEFLKNGFVDIGGPVF